MEWSKFGNQQNCMAVFVPTVEILIESF